MNHSWKPVQSQGVTGGNGRPHGVDTWQECRKCGCSRGSGPQSTHTGARVIRRWTRTADGYPTSSLLSCS